MLTFRKSLLVILAAAVCLAIVPVASAAIRTWIGGNADWNTLSANWNPADEPDEDDTAVFSTSNSVNLAIASQTILALTLSDGISLSTNGNDLTVNGLIELSDTSTDLFVGGSGSLLQADAITINNGAEITLTGGQITIVEESGDGLLDVNNGGELSGNGTIQFGDAVSAGTQLFNLDGTLTAHSTVAGDFLSLAFATLTINIADADGVIDLDGNDGVSTINVLRNDTLALNGGVLDSAYSGTINLSSGATFSRNVPWSFNGTLNPNTGGSTAATIAGAAFTQTGGSINVDVGETLRFSSVFNGNDGVLANNGLIVFDNAATVQNASQFQTGTQGSIEVNNGEVTVFDQGWDWDGDGGLDNRITINDLGHLRIFSLADNTWAGAMYLNGGTLSVFDPWGQNGGLINIGGTTHSSFNVVGAGLAFSKTGGAFNVEEPASLTILTDSNWGGGSLNVDGTMALHNMVTWNGGIAVTGGGAIYTEGTSVISANTTINIHTFDWDGFAFPTHNVQTINSGVTFTLNINNFDANINDNSMDDAINLGGNGAQLIINGPAQWIMDDTFTANTTGAGTATIGGTSRMVVTGTLFANGNTTVSAPITFGAGSTTVTDISAELRLTGGNLTTDPNRMQGGLITGQWGYLIANGGTALHGFGTIRTPIDFDETSNLKADNGVLTLTGQILGVNVLGTADSDGILNVDYPWNSGGNITAVELQGGEIQGGMITNDNANGIVGHGTIRARLINNTRIDAVNVDPFSDLWLTTVGNDNDWDGTTNTGSLNAQSAYLVLSDNAPFAFSGTVSASAGNHVYAHGFELDFQPNSTIQLTGGAYKSTETTHLRGTILVNAGADSQFELDAGETLDFTSTGNTTLNGNLRLNTSNAVIRAGATFSGTGALMVIDGAALFPDNAANVNVLIDNAGDFGVAGAAVGRADVRDFQQSATGELLVGLAGTALNQFDRLVVNGTAQLDGELDVALLAGFEPTQSDTFTVLSALAISGAFADVPAGSRVNTSGGVGSLRVSYGPNSPFGANQLVLSDFQEIVFGTGDYDGNLVFDCADVDALVGVIASGSNNQAFDLTGDGLVNSDDLSQWLAVAGANNLLSGNPYLPGDASLDGVVDGSDFVIWNSHKFTSVAEWCSGDFNADGVVDGLDFVIWNGNKFTSSDSRGAVPEPTLGLWSLLVACLTRHKCGRGCRPQKLFQAMSD